MTRNRPAPPAFLETLERRTLLDGLPTSPSPPPLSPPDAVTLAADAASAPILGHVDVAGVRDELVRFVDTWNGGARRERGAAGAGAYAAGWDGLFRVNLDRQFNPVHYYTDDQTIISQSRMIYLNVEAYRTAAAIDQPRFRAAVQKAADYLIARGFDPRTYGGKPGGLFWALQADGAYPPTHTTHVYGTPPRYKNAYGHVAAVFAFAQAYTVTRDADHLAAAFRALDAWEKQFADTAAGPGAYLPTATEDFSRRVENRNLDYMTHAFEAFLSLYDALPASDARRAGIATKITGLGNFITTRLYRNAAGSTSMGYLPWWYNAAWQPSSDPAQRYMTPGHNFEVAYLLSRAVERGFSSTWLATAGKLIAFALKYGFDNNPASPTYGAPRYEKLWFDGRPAAPQTENLVWWPAAEATRALGHFAGVRGRGDWWDEFAAALKFVSRRFIDPTYGGWYPQLSPATLAPAITNKGTVWTAGYHEAMLYAELLRLCGASAVGRAASIAKATVAPAIDGAVDGIWYDAVYAPRAGNVNGTISSSADCSLSWKALWDSKNLYLLVDVTDDAKRRDSTDVRDDDAVGVFLDGDYSRGTAYDGRNDLFYLFGWNRTGVVQGGGPPGRTAGIAWAQSNPSATRYRVEIRIPWSTIGVAAPTAGGRKLGIDVHAYDDDNGGARDGKLMWADTASVAWTNPSVFGTATIRATTPTVPQLVLGGL